jgi:hypothetical protein
MCVGPPIGLAADRVEPRQSGGESVSRSQKLRVVRNIAVAVGLWWGVSVLVVIASIEAPKRLHGGAIELKSNTVLTATNMVTAAETTASE